MDFLHSINVEQLGAAGILLVYAIWQNILLRKERDAAHEERKFWQQTAFEASREAQKELFSAVQTFKDVAATLRGE